MGEPVRQTCPGCRRTLKIRLDQVPAEDFSIQCPKCAADVVIHVADVEAVMGAGNGGGRDPLFPKDLPPPDLSSLKRNKKPPAAFATTDLTDEFMAKQRAASTGSGGIDIERSSEPSISMKRVIPRNAPRTSPPRGNTRPGFDPGEVLRKLDWEKLKLMKMPSPPILAAIGAGAFLLLVFLVWLAWPSGGSSGIAAPDVKLEEHIAMIRARHPDPGGEAPELFGKGLEKFRGDSSLEHKEAAEFFRRAISAAPHHPEPLAGLALNSLFLPRSERELGVKEANAWADYVQRAMPDSVLGGSAQAALLSSIGRHDDARETAAAQVARHGESALAWFIQGHVLVPIDPKAAYDSLGKALQLDPGFRSAKTLQARAALAQGKVRIAGVRLGERQKMGGSSGAVERIAAEIAVALGDPAAAIAHFQRAVELEAKDPDLRLEYGWRLAVTGDLARAKEQARRVIDVDKPVDDASDAQAADALLLLADVARRAGKGDEAVTHALAAQRSHPDRIAALYQLGLARIAAGKADDAVEPLRDAAQRDPGRQRVQLALGLALSRAGRFEDALVSLGAAREIDPSDALVHAALADVYADNELGQTAAQEWERMLSSPRPLAPLARATDPRFPRPTLDLPRSLARVKSVEASDPNKDTRFRLYEGAILCESGRVEEGLARFAQARGVEPGAAAYVAGWLIAAGRPKDALRMTIRVETASQVATRAWALKDSRGQGADKTFQQALQMDSTEPFANLGFAQLLIGRGNRKQALPYVKAAQARLGEPSPPVVVKALSEVE